MADAGVDSEARFALIQGLHRAILDYDDGSVLSYSMTEGLAEYLAEHFDHVGFDNPASWPAPFVRLSVNGVPPPDKPTPLWRWRT